MFARTQNSQGQAQRLWDSGRCEHQFFQRAWTTTNPKPKFYLYARVDEFWRKEDKYRYLDSKEHYRKHRMEADNA